MVLVALSAGACLLGCQGFRVCEAVDEGAVSELPERLSQTGLYASSGGEQLAPEVRSFRPRFELWSDGASKRRWLWLPPGSAIDTSDMDAWQSPVGTKLWKEFTRDGVRVETRLLQRQPDGWVGVAYLWREDGSDAIVAPYGAIDALGTPHDVPASNECVACHGGRSSHVLGFSAIQLAPPVPRATPGSEPGDLDLDELVRSGPLTHAPAAPPALPGDEAEQAALGYLHANCSHCHNTARPERDGARCFDPENELDFSLSASDAALADTNTFRTAVDEVIRPGRPDDSRVLERMSSRSRFSAMPPLATERVDADAVALLRRWIEAM